MAILVTGSSGLIGSALVPRLTADGHRVVRAVRREARAEDEVPWDPETGELGRVDALDAVIHLGGENIASGRWTAARKARIRDSRVEGTKRLVGALRELPTPPPVLITASAVGIYGDRGDDRVDHHSGRGRGFLAELCYDWEREADQFASDGTRVAMLRFGVVLSGAGGALKRMLLPFKLGLGGRVGNGRQYMSWISLEDAVGAIAHVLGADISGPVDVVAPEAVTNAEFTKALGRVLGRPTIAPLPAFAARIALGELADALLLASTRVRPTRLRETGYEFVRAELEDALAAALGRRPS